jgi:hypothetical protein
MTFDLDRWRHLTAHSEDAPRTEWRWGPVSKRFAPPCPWCAAGDLSDVHVEPNETMYVTPARAAELLEVPVQRVHALRRRGSLRSIGLTPREYARARARAGWGDAQGWGAGVFILAEDVERLARQRRAA